MIKEAVFKAFESSDQLAEQLAERIAQQLQSAIDLRGHASLVVSGGSTPLPLFKALSVKNIDWQQVYITLADERWVDLEDEASNEAFVRQHLLTGKAATAKFYGLKNMFSTAETGLTLATDKLAAIARPFDVVVLGMGNDGHTCSWFPCADPQALNHALTTEALLATMTPTTAPHERITWTKSAILASRQIYLHLVGESKKEVYQQALASDVVEAMPIRAVLAQRKTPVDVYWSA